jgi:hypothetical protein
MVAATAVVHRVEQRQRWVPAPFKVKLQWVRVVVHVGTETRMTMKYRW